MSPRIEPVAPTGAEATTLYVSFEISRRSWVVGIKGPASDRIGLHTLAAADVKELGVLIRRQRTEGRTVSRMPRAGAVLLRSGLRGVLAGALAAAGRWG